MMDGTDSFKERAEKWLKGIYGELEVGENELDQLKDFMESSLREAENYTSSDPSEAYGRLMKLANLSGHLAKKKPVLVELLSHYLQRFVEIMNQIKKALGALSFTIGVSFPFYLSFSLTF